MYKCHLCKLKTKQLNGLMSLHWKKHCNESYTVEQYKEELLTHNDRPPKICLVCNTKTSIPKGEKDYPEYHTACYMTRLSGQVGKLNNNYKVGKLFLTCLFCSKKIRITARK